MSNPMSKEEAAEFAKNFRSDDDDIQEYARPWVGLTDGEMLECLKAVDVATAVNLLMSQYEMPPTFKVYAKAIEAKLKEKNNG